MISTALLEQPTPETQQARHAATEVDNIGAVENPSFGDPSCVFQQHVPDFVENYDSFAELFGASGTSSFWEFPSQDMDVALNAQADLFNGDMMNLITSVDQGNVWLMQQE